MTRLSLRRVAQGLLCAMLFAQAALAAATCDWPRASPVKAFADSGAPSCHEAPERNTNLCLAHCLGGDQSADSPDAAAIAPGPTPVLVVAVPDPFDARAALSLQAPPRAGAPPPRILFHTLLI